MVHSGDDWERQLQLIEENEKCEASVVRIPEQLQAEYGRQFLKFGPSESSHVLLPVML